MINPVSEIESVLTCFVVKPVISSIHFLYAVNFEDIFAIKENMNGQVW